MSSYPVRGTRRVLLRKGFREHPGDHRYLRLVVDGRSTRIQTMLSHGAKFDYGDSLLALLARELKLTKKELLALLDCPLSHAEYVRLPSSRLN